MSTNDEQRRTTPMMAATAQRELATAELDGVSGGMADIHDLLVDMLPKGKLGWQQHVAANDAAMTVWYELLRQNGF